MSELQTERTPNERVYWRSVEELAQTPEFREVMQREFPEGASEPPDLSDPISRRRFVGAVAASAAMVSLASCRKPVRNILPFNQRPQGMVPGIAQTYATTLNSGGYGIGVLARSNEGRPTKIEGNPQHPGSQGGTSTHLQGEILNLYDPGRSRQVLKDGEAAHHAAGNDAEGHDEEAAISQPYGFDDFLSYWATQGAELTINQGEGLRFLLPPSSSPSLQNMLAQVAQIWPKAVLHTYASINRDEEIAGAKIALGAAYDCQFALDRSELVVSFDRDFLGVDPDMPRSARAFAKRRRVEGDGSNLSRLYVVESCYSLTGSNADHRLRVPASQISTALCALAVELDVGSDNPALRQALQGYKGKSFDYRGKNWLPILAKDLKAHAGSSCVMVGPSQPAIAHALAHAINQTLGNLGQTVNYTTTDPGFAAGGNLASMRALVTAMDEGQVDTLVMLESNPVYEAPADLDFATALAKVPHRIHLGQYVDETAKVSTWHVNAAHALESWGDLRSFEGTASIVQPLIAPLHGGHSSLEFLANLIDADVKEGYESVRSEWRGKLEGDFEATWNRALHDGLITGSAAAQSTGPSLQSAAIAQALSAWTPSPAPSASNMELCFLPDTNILDGRHSNNAWLQELPDPLTKLTWDNAALISPATARALDVERGDVVSLRFEGRSLDAPVYVLPGHADHSVTLTLGYGRDMGPDCLAAEGPGVNAYSLRSTASMNIGQGLSVQKTADTYELVTTQDHGSMEERPLIREATLSEYQAQPGFAPAMSPLAIAAVTKSHGGETVTEADLNKSLWEERDYSKGYQWGMVIDLNTCTGCNACVIACTSENNIPMVGKSQIAVGREMFWNRLDRYFSGPKGGPVVEDEPEVRHQMIPCMQCENAPCEAVCPVAATMHSPEGLNDMAYNRCIGTRYCGNNCPFKVRRFNFFNLTGQTPDVSQLANNPDVSVRPRGVMEKCTYCVQRINAGKRDSQAEHRKVRDGEITPACAQGCPTEAITFGDINDPNSKVTGLKKRNLNYGMLSELNLKTRTTFLAKVTNPNPELA